MKWHKKKSDDLPDTIYDLFRCYFEFHLIRLFNLSGLSFRLLSDYYQNITKLFSFYHQITVRVLTFYYEIITRLLLDY